VTLSRLRMAVFLAALTESSCSKSPPVTFPRPPATAAVPDSPSEPAAQESVPPSPPDATTPVQDAPSPGPGTGRPASREGQTPIPPPDAPPSRATRSVPAREDPVAIQEKIRRSESILESVSARSLSPREREQVLAARTFLVQAKDALAAGDPRRASVLADKGHILAQDVERSSR